MSEYSSFLSYRENPVSCLPRVGEERYKRSEEAQETGLCAEPSRNEIGIWPCGFKETTTNATPFEWVLELMPICDEGWFGDDSSLKIKIKTKNDRPEMPWASVSS